MPTKSSRLDKPGWLIIDRYMPNATPQEQETACENLVSLSKLLVRIDERLYEEKQGEARSTRQLPLF